MKRVLHGMVVAGLFAMAGAVAAQADATRGFPSRPVRIIVGYSVGGGNDIIARIVAQKLAENLGQSVIVENKPGVASIIAAEYVARAAPDGYTLLMGPSGPLVFNPAIYPKLPYSPQRDFAPIGLIGAFPLLLVVSQANPARNVKDLVEAAKAAPERAFYGASAASFQFATELFNLRTGAKFQRVPYKGANDSATAVVSGDVTLTIADPAPVVALAKAGKLKILATTAPQRVPAYPEIPTMAEAGVPGLEIELWAGLLAPAGTPPSVVRKLQDELARALASAEVKTRLQALSINVAENPTPQAFARTIAAELEVWVGVAKSANIRAE
jgi:tripartite-type tricarboxylate transporter receptor subunit TctC